MHNGDSNEEEEENNYDGRSEEFAFNPLKPIEHQQSSWG